MKKSSIIACVAAFVSVTGLLACSSYAAASDPGVTINEENFPDAAFQIICQRL